MGGKTSRIDVGLPGEIRSVDLSSVSGISIVILGGIDAIFNLGASPRRIAGLVVRLDVGVVHSVSRIWGRDEGQLNLQGGRVGDKYLSNRLRDCLFWMSRRTNCLGLRTSMY